jgi:hypothetical protein
LSDDIKKKEIAWPCLNIYGINRVFLKECYCQYVQNQVTELLKQYGCYVQGIVQQKLYLLTAQALRCRTINSF